jgi:hypothetical protein
MLRHCVSFFAHCDLFVASATLLGGLVPTRFVGATFFVTAGFFCKDAKTQTSTREAPKEDVCNCIL